jgi:hypothetical protein
MIKFIVVVAASLFFVGILGMFFPAVISGSFAVAGHAIPHLAVAMLGAVVLTYKALG